MLMPLPHKIIRSCGFTIIELLVVVVVVALLIGILVPVLGSVRRSSRLTVCQNNLHQLAIGFEVFVQSNHGRFPDDMSPQAWDDLLVPYVANDDDVFRCPSDPDHESRGISYNWRNLYAVGDPALSLGGREKGTLRSTTLILVFELLGSWHASGQINAATIDGAASAYSLTDFEANMELAVE